MPDADESDSFFKKVGRLIFEETAETNATEDASGTPSHTPVTPAPVAVTAGLANKLVQTVLGRKSAYTALMDAAEPMKSIIPDEATRTKAAFAVIHAFQQRTVEQVVQAIDLHASDLEGEEMRFLQSSKEARDKGVTSRQTEISNANNRIKSLHEEVNRANKRLVEMAEELRKAEQSVATLQAELSAEENKIQAVENEFRSALASAKADLDARKERLRAWLSPQ